MTPGEFIGLISCGDVERASRALADDPSLVSDRDRHLGTTPLIVAAHRGFEPLANELLAAGADAHARETVSDSTALHWAAEGGHLAIVQALVARGAALEPVDAWHAQTPLGWSTVVRWAPSAHGDRAGTAAWLRANGAVVDVFAAVALGEADTLRAIVRAAPDALDARLGFVDDLCTPLQLAAARGQLQPATALLDLGADVDARSMRGVTALAFALQRGHAAVADALQARGARYDVSAAIVTGDLDRAHADPDAPLSALLFAAVESGRERAIRWLLGHGASPDETLRSLLGERPANVTPLQRAAELGQVSCAGALLEHGANPNAGLTAGLPAPLHLAAGCGAIELVRLLLQHGADRTATESFYGATAAGWAAFAGHDAILELLAG